ncbi:MAG: sensor histidine kinase, partial [Tepidisphaerales bacterium]
MDVQTDHRRGTPGQADGPETGPAAAWIVHYRKPLLIFVAAVVVLFAASEYIERRWLSQMDMGYLHLLHFVRGITSALICGLLVAWLVSRAAPSPLPTVSTADDWLRGAWPDRQEWVRTFAGWFIAVRWAAIAVAAILVIGTIYIAQFLSVAVARPLLVTTAGLAVANLLYVVQLHRKLALRYTLPVQVYGDLAFFAVLLHFAGGIENPLSLLMVAHVIIGGTALGRRQCYAVAAVATVLLAILGVGEWQNWLHHYTLLIFPHVHDEQGMVHAAHLGSYVFTLISLHAVIFFVSAYFVSALAERMRYDERELARVASAAIASRTLLERALETTGTGLRVLDTNLRPYWCNSEWRRWLAADHPADPIAVDALATRQVQVAERSAQLARPVAEASPARKAERVLQLTAAPLLDASGAVSQIVELFQDITSQKETQAQAMRAGKLAAVGELAGQVAHEVNNPIAIVSAKARLLLQDHGEGMSPVVAQELRKIIDQSDRVAQIAQGLLSYCRPSTGARSPIPIRRPVEQALGIIEQRARGRQVRIDAEFAPDLPAVLANGGEMQQVFLNLLLNALDAMP